MGNSHGPRSDGAPPTGDHPRDDQKEERPKPRPGKRSVILRVLSALFRIIVTVLVLAALAVVFSVSVLPRVTGAQALIVLSGSMEPALPVGSVAIAGPVDPAEVEVGDVITFTHDAPAQTDVSGAPAAPLVTHRVVGIEETADGRLFHTRGDANTIPDDPPVPASDVLGTLWYHIPYFGYAQQALVQGPTLMFVLAGLLFVFGVWLLSVALGDDEPSEREEQQAKHHTTEDGGTSR